MKQRIIDFIKRDVWRIRAATMPRSRFFLLKNLRVAILALRGFNEDRYWTGWAARSGRSASRSNNPPITGS